MRGRRPCARRGFGEARAYNTAMELVRIIIALAMIGIVASLGSALFHLMTDKGESKKMVRALTIRVALSVGLFLVLMIAWALGLIQPLGAR